MLSHFVCRDSHVCTFYPGGDRGDNAGGDVFAFFACEEVE